jgi:hypothetical protein
MMDEEIAVIESIYSKQFDNYVFTDGFKNSVSKFIKELGIEVVEDAMRYACAKIYYHENKAIKYFCGICWNKIKGN